jgi:signal transduction histidine kinase/DNA-binding NarL/FixJ family response regulator
LNEFEISENAEYSELKLELIKQQKENKKLTRQLSSLENLIARTKAVTAGNTNLSAIIAAEKANQDIFFNLILKYSPDIILIFDPDGRFLYCTDIFLERAKIANFGLISGRLYADAFRAFLGEVETQRVGEILRGALETKQDAIFEQTVAIYDQARTYNIKMTPMFDSCGDLIGVMALFHDLTNMLLARQAEAASQAKSAFLASISHEIRTPLNAIMGLSEVELRNSLPDETRNNLEKIYNSGSTLLSIINDILDISKMESGKFELIPTKYDFPSLISDTISLNIVRVGSKPVMFEVEMEETIPAVLFGDEIRVKQILNNLLSNAFKYTNKGTVTLQVTCERRGKDAWFTYSVSDTGRGIKEDNLEKLFTEYRQVDLQANRSIEGTGLGLSICKSLVEMMDGDITVESEYGRGSIFSARIRQEIVVSAPIGPEVVQDLRGLRFINRSHVRNKNLARAYMPYGKVLIVDDVPTNLDVAKGLMIPYGLVIDCASSGKQAIEIIRMENKKYDVVFMDHMMPEMDGIEAVRIIRGGIGTDYARTVPVVALTANALIGNAEMFLGKGFQAFLSKPIDLLQLDQILNQWVRDKQSDETLREADEAMRKRAGIVSEVSAEFSKIMSRRIDGVDLEAGLKRYDNSVNIYIPILQSYIKHSVSMLDKIRVYDKEFLTDYAINVHGLKGASYGIGAIKAGRLAEELEAAARRSDYEFIAANNADLINTVELAVAKLLALLDEILGGMSEKSRDLRPAPDRGLMEQLRNACVHFKMTEIRTILSELDKYAYESEPGLIKQLVELADDVEYEEMQKRLEVFFDGS